MKQKKNTAKKLQIFDSNLKTNFNKKKSLYFEWLMIMIKQNEKERNVKKMNLSDL